MEQAKLIISTYFGKLVILNRKKFNTENLKAYNDMIRYKILQSCTAFKLPLTTIADDSSFERFLYAVKNATNPGLEKPPNVIL